MKIPDSKKVLIFPAHPAVTIHPDLWAQTVHPTDINDLRLDRIAELRDTIAAGVYRVSTADLAEKLITHMRSNA